MKHVTKIAIINLLQNKKDHELIDTQFEHFKSRQKIIFSNNSNGNLALEHLKQNTRWIIYCQNQKQARQKWGKYNPQIISSPDELKKTIKKIQCQCPICKGQRYYASRYPLAICNKCYQRTKDKNGQNVTYFNEGLHGGFMSIHGPNKEKRYDPQCYIDGIRCHADQARFGGIVVEVVQEQTQNIALQ